MALLMCLMDKTCEPNESLHGHEINWNAKQFSCIHRRRQKCLGNTFVFTNTYENEVRVAILAAIFLMKGYIWIYTLFEKKVYKHFECQIQTRNQKLRLCVGDNVL